MSDFLVLVLFESLNATIIRSVKVEVGKSICQRMIHTKKKKKKKKKVETNRIDLSLVLVFNPVDQSNKRSFSHHMQ